MRASVKSLAALLFAVLLFAIGWLNQRPSTHKPEPERASPAAAPAVKPAAITAASASPIDEPKHYRPPSVTAAVRRKVDDFIRRYKDMRPEDMQKSEEFSEMMGGFMEHFETPEFQRKLEERIETIQAAKGTKSGSLNIGFGKLESPESRAWLEAMFSEDKERMEEFILNKLDGAIFELSFDPTLEQTDSGVTVKGGAVPAPATDKLPD